MLHTTHATLPACFFFGAAAVDSLQHRCKHKSLKIMADANDYFVRALLRLTTDMRLQEREERHISMMARFC